MMAIAKYKPGSDSIHLKTEKNKMAIPLSKKIQFCKKLVGIGLNIRKHPKNFQDTSPAFILYNSFYLHSKQKTAPCLNIKIEILPKST